MGEIRRQVRVYGASALIRAKILLAYPTWVWVNYVVQGISLIIFVFFWRAVYANTDTINGLALQQTLNYIILARLFTPLTDNTNMIYNFGILLREGQMSVELLRPLDFQAASFGNMLGQLIAELTLQVPLILVAWLVLGLQLSLDPMVWAAFLISALLGFVVLFFFDWILGCLAFYVTEIWGVSVGRYAVSNFFSGMLIPIVLLPDWLQQIALALPFAQSLYVPVSILSGIVPLSNVPRVWLSQLIWLVALGVLSRLVFRLAVRKITVQGG